MSSDAKRSGAEVPSEVARWGKRPPAFPAGFLDFSRQQESPPEEPVFSQHVGTFKFPAVARERKPSRTR